MFNKFIRLFTSDITIIEDSSERKNNVVRQLVSRHSNGNVNLQQAKYITKSILKEKQKKVFSYKFV
jgi:hypothetical protein